jgi:signal transduction histidine kinase
MKLIRKLNKQYITYSFVVLVIAAISLFFVLKSLVEEETNEKIVNTYKQIELLVKNRPEELELYPLISVKLDSSTLQGRYFSDTTINIKNDAEEFRQLVVYTTIQRVKYKITVREFGIESDDLLESLTAIILLSFIGLLILLFVINKRISTRIWLPFFENLNKLKRFSLLSSNPFIPTETDTDEFNEMNVVLKSLTDKVISDYDNLKKFSENASHELQTPLAIIRTKIEALLDENTLSLTQAEKLQAIYHNINRLSKINKGLILLTKIEGKQFTGQEEVSFNDIIKMQIENFSELIEMKKLEFHYQYQSDWKINGDKILVEMLVNNLFSNSILHNSEKGRLIIELNSHILKFSNSGEKVISENERLFDRFYKSGTTGSTGLGLAISKQICLSLGLKISYTFKKQFHNFEITF